MASQSRLGIRCAKFIFSEGIPDEPAWLRPRIWKLVTYERSYLFRLKFFQTTAWHDIPGEGVLAHGTEQTT